MSVSFRYEDHGKSSCKVHFSVKGVEVVHSMAGTFDSWSDMLGGVCCLFDRADLVTVYFEEEPGEYRWRIAKLTSNRLRIRIYAFDDWDWNQPDESGKLLFDQPCGLVAFATAVYQGSCESWSKAERAARFAKAPFEYQDRALDSLRDILRGYGFGGGETRI